MSGKLLFTTARKRKMALLFSENRLTAARVLPEDRGRIGAVYIGKIKKNARNLSACFVEIADGEICFLPDKEAPSPLVLNRAYDGRLLEGDELVVQLDTEAQKTKLATVTARLTLTNDYFVLCMDGSSKIRYSGKLSEERKNQLQELLTENQILEKKHLLQDAFSLGKGFSTVTSCILRTKADTADSEELLTAYRTLQEEYCALLKSAPYRTCFSCLKEAPPVYQTILDGLAYPCEYDEILTDDAALYDSLSRFCAEKLPEKTVRLYQDESYPLEKLYSVNTHLSHALEKRVWLKSGGYLVIEPTEALTVIDVNSGKYGGKKAGAFRKGDPKGEYTAKINLEAAEEIARQLRLRNLSGMIVVDFINHHSAKKDEDLLACLRSLVKRDKLRTTVVDMTPLGLVEITRKKSDRPLHEQFMNLDTQVV